MLTETYEIYDHTPVPAERAALVRLLRCPRRSAQALNRCRGDRPFLCEANIILRGRNRVAVAVIAPTGAAIFGTS